MITPNAAKSYVTKLTRRNRNWRVKNLDPDPTKRKEQLRIIENRRKEIKHLAIYGRTNDIEGSQIQHHHRNM